MTQQVRTAYRKHPRRSWVLATLVVAMVAAVAIPLANGAAPKYYTFSAGNTALASGGGTSTVCLNQATSIQVTLKNLATQDLGSANLTLPTNVRPADTTNPSSSLTAATIDGVQIAAPRRASLVNESGAWIVKLRSLSLARNKSLVLSLTVSGSVADTRSWSSIIKQDNEFNDTGSGNLFQISGTNPQIQVTPCYVQLVFPSSSQPKDAETGSTITTAAGDPTAAVPTVEVRYKGTTTLVNTGTVTNGVCVSLVTVVGTGALSPATPCFDVVNGVASLSGLSIDDVGTYKLRATLQGIWNLESAADGTATSDEFKVADSLCLPGVSCLSFYNQGGEGSAATDVSSKIRVSLNYAQGGAPACTPIGDGGTWNQAYYVVGGSTITFPSVSLSYAWNPDQTVLYLTYYVPNDQWTKTQVARGNNDAEFCFEGVHETTSNAPGEAFPVKAGYSEPGLPSSTDTQAPGYAVCRNTDSDSDCELFYGVLPTVSNRSKVRSGGDPAVCERGTVDLGGVTYRSWTICIPYDWDPKSSL